MIVINTVNAQRFEINGIEYFKNFTPVVAGDTIKIVNTYASCIDLLASTHYSQFTVDGSTYASVDLLQSALLPVLYTRDTLGGGGSGDSFGVSIENNTTIGFYTIDWSAADNWELTLTGNTSLAQSNMPAVGKEKTITLYIQGDFALTIPIEWNVVGGGTYDGVNGSQFVIQSRTNSTTKYHTVINSLS